MSTPQRIADLLKIAEPDGAAAGNEEVRADTSRLLAWIERETDAAVKYVESENYGRVLPKGRAYLLDFGLMIETRAAVEELRASVSHSRN
jgi:hypothetical protein